MLPAKRPRPETSTDHTHSLCRSPDRLKPDHAACVRREGWSVYLQVALNGQQYAPVGQNFTYFAGPISVGTVYPPLGPTSGGTEVTVTSGSWVPFVDTGSVSCYIYKLEITNQGRNMMRGPVRPTELHRGLFEDELEEFRTRGWVNEFEQWSTATLSGSTEGTCVTSSWEIPDDVNFFASLNRLDLSDNSVPFEFYDDPLVANVYPTSGPATGVLPDGSPIDVTVSVSNFFPLCEEPEVAVRHTPLGAAWATPRPDLTDAVVCARSSNSLERLPMCLSRRQWCGHSHPSRAAAQSSDKRCWCAEQPPMDGVRHHPRKRGASAMQVRGRSVGRHRGLHRDRDTTGASQRGRGPAGLRSGCTRHQGHSGQLRVCETVVLQRRRLRRR